MDTSAAEVILFNHVTFTEASDYLSDLSKQEHISFHASQESRLHQVTGMNEDRPYFLGCTNEKAKTLTSLLRMLTLHACHVDGSFASGSIHPEIKSNNLYFFEHQKNYGNPIQLSQDKTNIQTLMSLFDRLFRPPRVLKMLEDCEMEITDEVNGGMLFIDDGEFLLLRCKMEEIQPKPGEDQQTYWSLVASVSVGELHGRLDEVSQKLRDAFTDPEYIV